MENGADYFSGDKRQHSSAIDWLTERFGGVQPVVRRFVMACVENARTGERTEFKKYDRDAGISRDEWPSHWSDDDLRVVTNGETITEAVFPVGDPIAKAT